ncbi:HTH-type transcriptional regulator GbpR [Achromobacter anxifer]|uniref:LysR substrate-binding domain-containing protein n=1 Tax=Achromobacter anxifer TaxID=1287737 RepID=UPI00155D4E44|nr:LysR substrate-binding domain-containing protein [Achromobacter anxifer]CAB5517225.1 HTH-type transcriptional regulator GbpR [Achromobacter anxifer]
MADTPTLQQLRSRLRIRHLVLLDELGRVGNLHRAAEAMHLSQPALSKLLGEAEALVGQPLFERSHQGVAPTLLGLLMIDRARLLLNELDATHAELAAAANGATGKVRAGIFPVVAHLLVPLAVQSLQEAHPALRIELSEGLEKQLLPALRAGELDCVVGRLGVDGADADLQCEILYDEATAVVCGPAHPLAARSRLSGAALDGCRWVLPSRNAALYSLVAAAVSARGAGFPQVAIESSAILTIVSLLQRTSLLSAIPLRVARSLAAQGQLAILPLALQARLHPVGIMTRRDARAAAAVSLFLHALRTAATTVRADANA